MTDRETMKMAFNALLLAAHTTRITTVLTMCAEATDAIRDALAQPEQEPVAYIDHVSGKPKFIDGYVVRTDADIPLYMTPSKREWVGLTDEELAESLNINLGEYDLCLEVEAKLKEKNT